MHSERETERSCHNQITKAYFSIHTIMNVKNSHSVGPLQKQISDLMYTKHVDINFFYNTFSHLGILDCLKSVTNRQSKLVEERKVEDILKIHALG